jgi:hypothetical protein
MYGANWLVAPSPYVLTSTLGPDWRKNAPLRNVSSTDFQTHDFHRFVRSLFVTCGNSIKQTKKGDDSW